MRSVVNRIWTSDLRAAEVYDFGQATEHRKSNKDVSSWKIKQEKINRKGPKRLRTRRRYSKKRRAKGKGPISRWVLVIVMQRPCRVGERTRMTSMNDCNHDLHDA